MNTFYVTTAIDYPNGKPHVGHAYEKILADCYARWHRFLGFDVFYLTGTDENGQKLVKAARDAGYQRVDEFVDHNVEHFKKLCEDLDISYDDFIRTTEKRHHKVAQDIWSRLESQGDIYFDRYAGHYCLSCEAFYLDSQAQDRCCPVHGTPLEHIEEDGYFFRLSRYHEWIIDYLEEHESFVFPHSARKELLSRLRGEELRDLSVSRPNHGWGIPTPHNPDHVMYTWFDALINYYTAVISDPARHKYWPAQMHVIGKDIIWFHAVIWPCMLQAAQIALPHQVYVHGMLLGEDGRKMSKSLHNVIDPYDLITQVPNDSIRYYFLRAIPSGLDGSLSLKDMKERHNNELANDFGNLVLRVLKLARKRLGPQLTCEIKHNNVVDGQKLFKEVSQCMDARQHHRALDALWNAIKLLNTYLNEQEPWRIKNDETQFQQIMLHAIQGILYVATLMQPFLPHTAASTLDYLGVSKMSVDCLNNDSTLNLSISENLESLFPKLES